MVVVETDILVKYLSGDSEVAPELEELLKSKAAVITPVQSAELVAYTAPDEVEILWQFVGLFKQVELSPEVALQAGKYLNQFGPHYDQLTVSDCLTAAAAVSLGADLYTNDPSRFPMTELKLYNSSLGALKARTKDRLPNFDLTS